MLNKRETAAFCSQLTSLLRAGLPLLDSLKVIEDLPLHKRHRLELASVIDRLNSGLSFSEAAASLLPAPACGSLAAAERAGGLEENLARLAAYYNDKAELDEKVAGALVYPVFVLVLSSLSVLALVIFVIPGMRSLLSDLDAELPPVTLFILGLSDACANFWPALLILSFIMGVGLARFRRRNPAAAEKLLLKLPLISKLYLQELIVQSFGTLGALLKGGAPIIEAVSVTLNSTASPLMRDVLTETGRELSNGEKLSSVLAKRPYFPGSLIQLLKIGERTGQLDQMLAEIAAFQAREREVLLKRCVSLIEPSLTLAVGLVVGVVVLAMFLPLVDLVSSLQ